MHKLQKILLKRLSQKNNQRYSTLTQGYDFEDNIVFHLNKLINDGLIEKKEGIYMISLKGIKEIAKYEPFDLEDKGVKTLFIGFLCEDEQGNYLIKQHSQAKNNFYNLPSGKPFFGENIEAALSRCFKLNTGVEVSPENFGFVSLHLKTIKTSDGEVVFDDAFAIYTIKVNQAQKQSIKLIDSVSWMSVEAIGKLEDKWPEIDLCVLKKDKAAYMAYMHTSNYIL